MSSTVRKDETGNENPKRTSITVLVLGDGKFSVMIDCHVSFHEDTLGGMLTSLRVGALLGTVVVFRSEDLPRREALSKTAGQQCYGGGSDPVPVALVAHVL
jgi:hypothetical protein